MPLMVHGQRHERALDHPLSEPDRRFGLLTCDLTSAVGFFLLTSPSLLCSLRSSGVRSLGSAGLQVQLSGWEIPWTHPWSLGSRHCGLTRARSSTRLGDLQRTQLDADSWVDHAPLWMSGSERAFEELLGDVAWSQRRRWMYDREVDETWLTSWQRIGQQSTAAYQWLEDARVGLSTRYDVLFDSVGINSTAMAPTVWLAPRPHPRRDPRSHCGPRVTR